MGLSDAEGMRILNIGDDNTLSSFEINIDLVNAFRKHTPVEKGEVLCRRHDGFELKVGTKGPRKNKITFYVFRLQVISARSGVAKSSKEPAIPPVLPPPDRTNLTQIRLYFKIATERYQIISMNEKSY